MDLHIVRIPAEVDVLKVLFLGDCHGGHRCFDERLLDYYLGLVDANTRILILGDLFEAANRKSPGRGPADQVMTVSEQRKFWQRKLEPFKGQIDAAVTGNHEERIPNEGGDDMMEVLCELLGIKYLGYAGVVMYSTEKSGKCAYTIAIRHGSSNAILAGSAMNSAQRNLWNVLADVYVSGHVHKPSFSTNIIEVPNPENGVMLQREQYIITNGALLRAKGSYAELKGYPVAKPCQAIIKLSMNKHKRKIEVDWE